MRLSLLVWLNRELWGLARLVGLDQSAEPDAAQFRYSIWDARIPEHVKIVPQTELL